MNHNGAITGVEGIFEFGDHQHQREYPKDHIHKEQEPYHEGKPHMHNDLDSKDQRSLSNKLEAEEHHHHENPDSKEVQQLKRDPTLPALMHGNQPSKGAIIDAQIQHEEEEQVRKMGKMEDFSEPGRHSSGEKGHFSPENLNGKVQHGRVTQHHR